MFVELPDVGRVLKQAEVFGTIESVKAVSELFAPVSGEVIAVNTELGNHPDYVNSKAHDTWMIRVKLANSAEAASLLKNYSAYEALTK